MKRIAKAFPAALLAASLLLGAGASARADGMLPLRKGIYVDGLVPCAEHDNSNVVGYWGSTLAYPHGTDHIRNVERHGDRYDIDVLSVGGGGVGGDARTPGRTSLLIQDPESFRYKGGRGAAYRWCAADLGHVGQFRAVPAARSAPPPSCPGRVRDAVVTMRQGDLPRENAEISGAVTDPPGGDVAEARGIALPGGRRVKYLRYSWNTEGMPSPELRCTAADGRSTSYPVPPGAHRCFHDTVSGTAACH